MCAAPAAIERCCNMEIPPSLARLLPESIVHFLTEPRVGLHPAVAKHLPATLVRFCVGLRYPHAFVFSIPAFVVCLLLNDKIPYAQPVVLGLGVAMFYFSKARWR